MTAKEVEKYMCKQGHHYTSSSTVLNVYCICKRNIDKLVALVHFHHVSPNMTQSNGILGLCKFHKDWFRHSKVSRGIHRHTALRLKN
jgi:hypothetical protein